MGESVNAAGTNVAGAGLVMTAVGAGLLDMTKQMAEAGASYQQEMAFVNALAGGTAQTAQMLQDEALKLDRTTVFSAQDIAAGMEQLAREGFNPLQIAGTNAMNSLIQNASNMAAALKISMPDAANMLGMTMRAFNIDVSQTAATTDILTEAALRSGKSADEFNTQLQYVEATASQLHIPLQDVSAAVGELMSQNVPGAGQGLRAFLVGITSEGSTAQKEMAKLGISAFDAQGNFIGLGPVIDEVNQALKGLTPAEQSAAIKALSGGNRQVTALIQLLRDGSTGLTDFETKMGTLGGAAHVMSTLMDTAAGSLKAFFSSLETAKILMGESFLPLIRPVVDGLREVLGAFIQGPAILHAFAAAAIAVTGALFTLAGGLAIFKALDMGTAIDDIVGSMLDLAPPLALAAAAIGALYLAYRNNFLGFGDTVNGVIDKFQQWLGLIGTIGGEFGRLYTAWRDQGYGPISASIMAIADGIREAFGGRAIIDTLNNTASQASRVAQRAVAGLLNAITGDFNSVLQLVGGSEFGKIGDKMANALAKNFGLTLKANIPQSLKDLGASFADFGNLIAHPVQAMLDFANLLTRIAVGINTIGNAFTSGLADLLNGRWAAAWLQLGTIVQIATDAFDAVVTAASGIAATIANWTLHVAAPAVVDFLGDVGAWIGDHIGAAAATAASWIMNVAVPAAVNGLENAGTWIEDHLGSAVATLKHWTLTVAVPTAITGFEALSSWVQGKITTATAHLTNWTLTVGIPTAITGFEALSGWIQSKVTTATAHLTSWTLSVGIPSTINGLEAAGTWMQTKLGTPTVHLLSWVLDVGIPGTINGLTGADIWIATKLGSLTVNLLSWTLMVPLPAGITGLDAVEAKIGSELASVNWTSALANAGTAVGNGLGSAIKTGIGDATNILSAITSALKGAKWGDVGKSIGGFLGKAIIGMGAADLGLADFGAHLIAALGQQLGSANWGALGTVLWQLFSAYVKANIKLDEGIGTGLFNAFKPLATKAVDGLKEGWSTAIESFKTIITNLPHDLQSLANGADTALTKIGTQLVKGLDDGWRAAIESVKSYFKTLPSDLASQVPADFGALKTIGENMAKAFYDGIINYLSAHNPFDPSNWIGGGSKAKTPAQQPVPPTPQLSGQTALDDQAVAAQQRLQATFKNLTPTLAGAASASNAYANAAKGLYLQLLAGNGVSTQYGNAQQRLGLMLNDSSVAAENADQGMNQIQKSMQNATLGAKGFANGMTLTHAALGGVVAQIGLSAANFTRLGGAATASAAGVGSFASRVTASAAGAAAIAAAAAAAGRAIGQFADKAVTSAAGAAIFAAKLSEIRSQVSTFASGVASGMAQATAAVTRGGTAIRTAATLIGLSLGSSGRTAAQQLATGLQSGMAQAVAAVASGGAAIRAAAQLIGLSLAASGRTAGQQFAQGLGTGALQAAADMAQAAAAILAVATMVAAQLGAAGTSGGLAFAVGIGMGALMAAADMAGAGAAIEGIANSIMGALSAAGAAAGASFAAGIAAGMAMAEGAAAAGVGAIIAICSGVDLFGPGFATGQSFGAGVAAGLASEEGAVAAEAAQIVATAAAASAAAAQIHSPSRLFFGQGVQWGLGLAGGAKSTAQLVASAAADLVRLPTLPTLPSSGFAGAGASGAGGRGSGSVTIDVGGIHVHVDGGQAHDVNALAVAVTEKIGPVLEHIANRQRRGQGVWR